MISDVLSEAVGSIDEYLKDKNYDAMYAGVLRKEIEEVRQEMDLLRRKLDAPPSLKEEQSGEGGTDCPKWLNFLEDVVRDEVSIEQLRGWIAGLLRGDRLHQALLLIGPGLGKSTLAQVVAQVVGSDSVSRVDGFTKNTCLAPLKNSRLNICEEDFNFTRCSTKLKSIMGGDTILSREPYQRHYDEFVFEGALLFTSNGQIGEQDLSLEARLLRIEFAGPSPSKLNFYLRDELLAEIDQIKVWAAK